jgi:hypothetical protein
LVLHGDYRGGLGRYGNREDVFLGFDLAEEVLVSDVLEAEGRFVFASCADFGRKQQRTRAIFNVGDDEFVEIAIVCAIDPVSARLEVFFPRPQNRGECKKGSAGLFQK